MESDRMTMEYHELKMEKEDTNILKVKIKGKFEKEDYDMFVPAVEDMIKRYGKIRILLILEDFQGWTASSAWEDTKFGLKHFNDLEKLAMVGDKSWEKGLEIFCKVFTTGEVRFFQTEELIEAEEWLRS